MRVLLRESAKVQLNEEVSEDRRLLARLLGWELGVSC